jgi:hypothetical protein
MAAFGKSWRAGIIAMAKKRRVYQPRVVGGQIMMQADLERLHKYMLEIEGVDAISDEMREVVEELWPELVVVPENSIR